MSTSTELVTTLNKAAARYRGALVNDTLKWAAEKQHCLSILRGSATLRHAAPESLQSAMLQSASMGLTLNPVKAHCYLIPRRLRRRKDGESKTDFERDVPFMAYASPSYRGLSYLATNSGRVRFIKAEVVFKTDHFEYNGPFEKPTHRPSLAPKGRTEANAMGVYAGAKTSDGDWLCEWIDRETILRIRQMSDFPNGAMWNPQKLWTEGWKKSCIRRLYKTLPEISAGMDNAIGILNEHEGVREQEEPKEPKIIRVINTDMFTDLSDLMKESGIEEHTVFTAFGISKLDELPVELYETCKLRLQTYHDAKEEKK